MSNNNNKTITITESISWLKASYELEFSCLAPFILIREKYDYSHFKDGKIEAKKLTY